MFLTLLGDRWFCDNLHTVIAIINDETRAKLSELLEDLEAYTTW